MFTVGEKVVYPMHGAGTIESIEKKEVLGETREYYILRIFHGNMKVMVPVDGSEQAGLRTIIDESEVSEVIKVLKGPSTPMDKNWNRRNRENMERLKTGNIHEVAAVVRNLTRVDSEKKLSMGERKLLTNAKQILSSELAFVENKDEEKISDMIDQAILT